jgi:hypothetical protein
MVLRVLIVDDNRSFLEAASVLLERQGLSVVGLALTTAAALRETQQLRRISSWLTSRSRRRAAWSWRGT